MSNDSELIPGLYFKPPHERAPDFVKAKASIKVADLRAWLEQQSDEWVNLDIKESRGGKWYGARDNWKPERQGGGQRQESAPRQRQAPADDFPDDAIPF